MRPFHPYPKKLRVSVENFTQTIRERDGVCLYGVDSGEACSDGLDGHHIQTRGSGGGDLLENGITLCRLHHNKVHNGLISKSRLREILTKRYGYVYETD
jgi:hypothetical protein